MLLASGYFVAPWALGFAEVSSVPAWNAWVVSLLVAGLAAAALHAAGASPPGPRTVTSVTASRSVLTVPTFIFPRQPLNGDER